MLTSVTSPPLNPSRAIVVIDDEPAALEGVMMHLRLAGFTNIQTFTESRFASRCWQNDECAVVILDVMMPGRDGLDTLKEIKGVQPNLPVIMVTGVSEIDSAIICLRNGAYDYLLKPVESERLIASVNNALKLREMEDEYTRLAQTMLSDRVRNPSAFSHIRAQSDLMLRLFQYVESVGPTAHPVLITGETGTGKELFARAIHTVSARPGDLISVNIAGLDDTMFSDTLFGHVKGAFTGADSPRAGLIESARGKTLFLDEIGDLSIQSQVKLLRLIQEKEYRQLGSDAVRPCEARIITATCRTMAELGNSTLFRKDLFYRLRTHHIHIPPLRERREDLPVLSAYFIEKAAQDLGCRVPSTPDGLFPMLNEYLFPGNVRELEAIIIDAMSNMKNGRLVLNIIQKSIGADSPQGNLRSSVTFHESLPTLKEVEHLLINEAFSRASGNQTVAAQMLGITRQTLAYRLKQIGATDKEV